MDRSKSASVSDIVWPSSHGKTSILRNINACLGNGVKLAYKTSLCEYVQRGQCPAKSGGSIDGNLWWNCWDYEYFSSKSQDLLKLPDPNFRKFRQQVDKVLVESPQTPLQKEGLSKGKGLIIALDEFEKIEDLINAGKNRTRVYGNAADTGASES